jgi:hypothetical protein
MSTKTITKRVALATVVALGAGVLSLVTVSSANASAAAGSQSTTAATSPAVPAATIGILSNGATGSSTSASSGLLAATATSGTTMTATLLSGGAIAIKQAATAQGDYDFVVTGGTISSTSTADTLSSDSTTATFTKIDTASGAILVKPNAGVSTVTIQLFDDVTLTATGSNPSKTVTGITTQGTLAAQVIVTVAAASVSGAVSTAKSLVNTGATATTATGIDAASTATGSISTIANAGTAFVNFKLLDAYQAAVPDGAIIATATGGAVVGFSAATAIGATAVKASGNTGTIYVAQGTANVSQATTVTLSYNGTTVGTKSFTFLGNVAKVVASSPKVASKGGSDGVTKDSNADFLVRYYDAAGNELFPSDAGTATSLVSGLANGIVSAVSVTAGNGTAGDAAQYSYGAVTAGSAGSTPLQLQYVNATDGSIIKSNTWTQAAAGDADSYTAKWDKASYTPGSVATLTITFKDIKGNLANHLANKITDSTGTNLIAITGGPSAAAVVIPATTDVAGGGTDADGTKTYQFVVTQVDGTYSAIVSAPVVNAKDGSNQTVAYTVASGSTSLNDVLKGIVSLIASINKQIAALAKLVAPKAVAKKK